MPVENLFTGRQLPFFRKNAALEMFPDRNAFEDAQRFKSNSLSVPGYFSAMVADKDSIFDAVCSAFRRDPYNSP
jgi:hypothetical protein